jgi:hypothetical protein
MKKDEEKIQINKAIENLASIAELDINSEKLVGITKNHKFVLSDSDYDYKSVQWLSAESAEDFIENAKKNYVTILNYLKKIYESGSFDYEDPNNRKRLQSIMALVGEAANKLDIFCDEISGVEVTKLTESKQYLELKNFYRNKISKKFEIDLEGNDAWIEDYFENEKILDADSERLGIKDFDTVRKDKEYELFYIRQENGHPYFNPALLKNIKLVCDFDELSDIPDEEDPLLRIRAMQDKDLHGGAQQILKFCEKDIQEFFKLYAKDSASEFAQLLNRCVMALMLTSNSKNLIKNTSGKSSLLYFSDFLNFLRKTLESDGYNKVIAYLPEETDEKNFNMCSLIHHLCEALFIRKGAIKEEMTGFIYHMIHRGEKLIKVKKSHAFTHTTWNQILNDDLAIREVLKRYPNGPLFKILDLLRSEEMRRSIIPFDPIIQENHPHWLYDFKIEKNLITFIRLPCPTTQSYIHKAKLVNEFLACLRSLFSNESTYLVINLQNRTSWKDFARCEALEKLTQHAEFYKNVSVITLSKDTDFYYQIDDYFNLNDSDDFLNVLKDQIKSETEAGFYFGIREGKSDFIKKLVDLTEFIHSEFFESSKNLSRKMRLDFIELFYHFLTLELIQIVKPRYISFSCKDGIDVSAAVNASFYSFIKLLNNKKLTKVEKDTALWLYYRGALLIRERLIDSQRFNRTLSFLDFLEEKMKKVKKDNVNKKFPILKNIKIID